MGSANVTSASGVIVVGAGPVGLTTAFLLANAGVSVTVYEATPSVPHELRASTWHPPTLDMLKPSGFSYSLLFRPPATCARHV